MALCGGGNGGPVELERELVQVPADNDVVDGLVLEHGLPVVPEGIGHVLRLDVHDIVDYDAMENEGAAPWRPQLSTSAKTLLELAGAGP